MPGSFDPFTTGHASLVERGLELFDELTIVVGYNIAKPDGAAKARSRAESIAALYAGNHRVKVEFSDGLTVDLCRRLGARFILRGARSVADFEYERSMADVNREIAGVETVILFTLPELAAVSSSMVRELMQFGADVSRYIPEGLKMS